MRPGETVTWVNDQILASGTPKSAKVTVGQPDSTDPAQIPEIAVSPPRLQQDSSGLVVRGTMTNKSQIDQRKLTLFAVARQGGEIVAAGRGGYKNLRADAPKPGNYNIFFIGDPRGAEITVTAPPSVVDSSRAGTDSCELRAREEAPMSTEPPTEQLGMEGETCGACGAALATDQRYCLNCGTARTGPRLDFTKHLVPAAGRRWRGRRRRSRRGAPGRPRAPRRWRCSRSTRSPRSSRSPCSA